MRSLFLVVPLLLASSNLASAQDLSELVEKLGDASPAEREGAASALGALGTRAAPACDALIRASTDANFKVRCASTKALAELGTPPLKKVLERLVELLSDKSAFVQVAAAEALAQLKVAGAAIQPLEKLLSHKRFRVRAAALVAISSAGAKGKPALATVQRLADSDPSKTVRERAARAAQQVLAALAEAEASKTFLGATFREEPVGLVVTKAVTPQAMRYGLRPGTNLVAIDQHRVQTRADLKAALSLYAPGEEIAFKIRSWGYKILESSTRHILSSKDWEGLASEPVLQKPSEDTPQAWAALFAQTERKAELVAIATALKPHLDEVLPTLVEGAFTPKGRLRPASEVLWSTLGESAVAGLLASLESEVAYEQSRASKLLGAVGPPAKDALPRLEEIARGRGYQTDSALAAYLKIAGTTPKAWALIQSEVATSDDLRWLEEAWPYLGQEHWEKLLRYPNKEEVRAKAAGVARSAKSVTLIPVLLQRLRSETGRKALEGLIDALRICPEGEHLPVVIESYLEILAGQGKHGSAAQVVVFAFPWLGKSGLKPLLEAYSKSESEGFKRNSLVIFSLLAQKHPEAVPPLLGHLESKDPKVLRCVGAGLGASTGEVARAAIKEVFKRNQPALLIPLLGELSKNAVLGPEFEAEILAALVHADSKTRAQAVSASANLGLQSAREPLRVQLDSLGEGESAWRLLEAFIALGPEAADLDRLGRALEGENPREAMRALCTLGAAAAKFVPKILVLLSNRLYADNAEDFLVRIGKHAIEQLEAALAKAEGKPKEALARVLSKLPPK